jgi:hypothetical protein
LDHLCYPGSIGNGDGFSFEEGFMKKYDWLELATRILGVFFVAQGAIGVLVAIVISALSADVGPHAFFTAIGTSFIGTLMLLLAPGFVGWLDEKDAKARKQQHRPRSDSESVSSGG